MKKTITITLMMVIGLCGYLVAAPVPPFSLPDQSGNSGKLLTTNGSVSSWTNPVLEIDCSGNATITSAQALQGIICNNYGQAAASVNINLPTAAAGMSIMAVMGTAQAGNYWHLTSATAGTMYLDGSATGKNWVGYAATVVGNYFSCFSFRTGASAWSWICSTGAGTTTTN